MKRFTVKAKGTLLGILYTRDRVFMATKDGKSYLLMEYDRHHERGEAFAVTAYSSKGAVMQALKDDRAARLKEEA
jgi:hypothetical protein